MGSKTVLSGSVNRSKTNPSQSLQMIERPLMTPDELKSMPKGQFVVMKTGFLPMIVKLKLYFEWGIKFDKTYKLSDRGNRKVSYAGKDEIEAQIMRLYKKQFEENEIKEEHPNVSKKSNDTKGNSSGTSMPMSESNDPPKSTPLKTERG